MRELPEHLQKILDKRDEELRKLGGDPDWYSKALKLANERGDDDALIHAVIPN